MGSRASRQYGRRRLTAPTSSGGLAGVTADAILGALAGTPIDPGDLPPATVDVVVDLGLAGLALAPGTDGTPDPAGPDLPADHPLRLAVLAGAFRDELQREVARAATDALRAAGVRVVPFRGAALVDAGLYPLPGSRPRADLDLLIPEADASTAIRVLAEVGFTAWGDDPGAASGWLDTATFDAPGSIPDLGMDLDLHWRISRGGLRFGVPGLETALPDPDWAGPRVEPHLVHLAEHLLKHLRVGPHLFGWADLVRLAPRVSDWDEVVQLARTGPLATGTAALLDTCRTRLGAAIPPEVPGRIARFGPAALRGMDPVRALLSPSASRGEGLARRWAWAGGGGAAAVELLGAALPSRAWLRARYPDTPGILRTPRFWGHSVAWLLGLATSPASGNQEWEEPGGRTGKNRPIPSVDTPEPRL